jgi:methionyl-tRNA formyltransferase
MKVAFAGTPEFARQALQAVHAAGHDVVLVLTQPDRPAGRGMRVQTSAVKQFAQAHGMALCQPRGLRLDGRFGADAQAARAALEHAAADVLVVAAYGLILPAWVLALPRHGALNIHGSLLPRWRGAAPIQRAIEAGDSETGITIMQMDAGLDTGAMLLARPVGITVDDTGATLHDRLADAGARLIVQALHDLQQGDLHAQPQPQEGVTYAHKIDKREAAIDWHAPATLIERRVRAFDPFPGATAEIAGQPLKVWRARVVPGAGVPGRQLDAGAGRLVVACGEGALELLTLQLPGGRRIRAQDYLQRQAAQARA